MHFQVEVRCAKPYCKTEYEAPQGVDHCKIPSHCSKLTYCPRNFTPSLFGLAQFRISQHYYFIPNTVQSNPIQAALRFNRQPISISTFHSQFISFRSVFLFSCSFIHRPATLGRGQKKKGSTCWFQGLVRNPSCSQWL